MADHGVDDHSPVDINANESKTGPSHHHDPVLQVDPSSSSGPPSIHIKATEDIPASTTRGWRFYGAFGTLCLVTFIIALDSTIICVALPVSSKHTILSVTETC
jgi:hypothetical protein